MVAFLLPVLFPDTCDEDATATARIVDGIRQRRRLQVMGIQMMPQDQVVPAVQCDELDVATNNCAFVDGALTFSYREGSSQSSESYVFLILDRLKFGMDNDYFLSAHPSIERVTFIVGAGGDVRTLAPSDFEGRNIEIDDSDTLPWWPWVLVGGAFLTVCSGVMVYRRNQTPEEFSPVDGDDHSAFGSIDQPGPSPLPAEEIEDDEQSEEEENE